MAKGKIVKGEKKKRKSKYTAREDGKVLCPSCLKKGGEKWVDPKGIKFGMCEACRDKLSAKYEPVKEQAVGVGKKALIAVGTGLAGVLMALANEKLNSSGPNDGHK